MSGDKKKRGNAMENKIIHGDALEELKKLPDGSINMCMTSPPYWALRDYGDSVNSIWDETKGCEHDFEIIENKNPNDRGGNSQFDPGGMAAEMGIESTTKKNLSGFCNKCNAWKGQLGLEPTFDLYIKHLCDIFDEVKRVLRDDGTCWVNMGDTYNSHSTGQGNVGGIEGKRKNKKDNKANTKKDFGQIPDKCLTMIPSRFAIEMVNRGWILRNTIIWYKPNCMPSSVKDRFTVDFEYIFFFSKKKKYYFETQREGSNEYFKDVSTIKSFGGSAHVGNNPANRKDRPIVHTIGRNMRTVWKINPKGFNEAHFAVYPEELCETPIKAGCPIGGLVLDPFFGAGTTGLVALKQNKKFVGIELNLEYIEIAKRRLTPWLEQRMIS